MKYSVYINNERKCKGRSIHECYEVIRESNGKGKELLSTIVSDVNPVVVYSRTLTPAASTLKQQRDYHKEKTRTEILEKVGIDLNNEHLPVKGGPTTAARRIAEANECYIKNGVITTKF